MAGSLRCLTFRRGRSPVIAFNYGTDFYRCCWKNVPTPVAWRALSRWRHSRQRSRPSAGFPARRNPLLTTSWGTGELIRHALDAGVRQIIIGIGGSATNDGGAGMVQALGAKLLTRDNQQIGAGGQALESLARIDVSELDKRLAGCRIDVACDVTNPLTGPQGATAVFGPQKGATAEMIASLDKALAHFAEIIHRDLELNVLHLEGGGAAGGMGAGLYAFCGAKLRPGIEIVTDALHLADIVADADLVITGEGRIDRKSVV